MPSAGILDLFGITSTSPSATPINSTYGGYINSLAFRSQGIEVETETRLTRNLFTRAGYTYTDAVVQHSFSSDNVGPSYNTASNFGNLPIGADSPLVGARPFASRRIAATLLSTTRRITSTLRSPARW